MKQQVRVIKTQRDYAASLARLSALMDQKFAHGSNQENELDLLALVIEATSVEKSRQSSLIPSKQSVLGWTSRNLPQRI